MLVSYTNKYTLYGCLFGIFFPVFATLLDCFLKYNSITPALIIDIQKNNPLLWIIDTAPLFLAIVARMVGKKRDELEKVLNDREAEIEEKTKDLRTALTDLKIKNEKIIELSIIDALTSVFNRAYINEYLTSEIKRAMRYDPYLAVIMMDIDYFKKINDEFGHLVGDKVLVGLANCLKNNLRSKVDWVGRFGGEEFLVVLPQTSLQNAYKVAQKLQKKITEKPMAGSIYITVSFGLAGYNLKVNKYTTMETFIATADENLYKAKRDGRNCIRGYP